MSRVCRSSVCRVGSYKARRQVPCNQLFRKPNLFTGIQLTETSFNLFHNASIEISTIHSNSQLWTKTTAIEAEHQVMHVIELLKGESQGHNAIFKGLIMTFRTNILKKTILLETLFWQLFSKTTFHFWPCSWSQSISPNARNASLVATLPVFRIIYQSCSPRSPPSNASSADTL